jgi:hypothetical protein
MDRIENDASKNPSTVACVFVIHYLEKKSVFKGLTGLIPTALSPLCVTDHTVFGINCYNCFGNLCHEFEQEEMSHTVMNPLNSR